MTVQVFILILLAVGATTAAIWFYMSSRHPVDMMERIRGVSAHEPQPLFLMDPGTGWTARIGIWLNNVLPKFLMTKRRAEILMQAGFTVPTAPALYVAAQIGAVIAGGVMTKMLFDVLFPSTGLLGFLVGGTVGFLIPPAFVGRKRDRWQTNIRKAIPDALDLLLVCVEAGVSLDTAIVRVGRELTHVYPEIANELLIVNRKQNAGIPRDEALRGLWERTAIDELRTLASSVSQSERWGTSISRVLRIESEVLRRKRGAAAERRAAVVSTKMLIPLALLILPALFAVVGGPAVIQIQKVLDATPAR